MADIVVFGATGEDTPPLYAVRRAHATRSPCWLAGYTGRLVTEYLYAHPERSRFTLGICARSEEKVVALKTELHLDDSVKVFYADVTKREEVEGVVKQAKVVIAAVGPFWKYGTPLARCALILLNSRCAFTL